MSLAELQRGLMAAVCDTPATHALNSRLAESPGPGTPRRLRAYRDTVREVHRQALASAYPVCVGILGRRYWDGLVADLIDRQGSTERDLARHGRHLPALLAAAVNTRAELADFDYLPDLARLEWRAHRIRYAADAPVFDLAAFASLSPTHHDRLRLTASPGLTLARSDWPVDALWRAKRAGLPSPALEAGAVHFCIHRGGRREPAVARLGEDEARLLDGVLAGSPLSVLAGGESGETEVAQRLFDWIMGGWIVGFAEVGPSCSTTRS